MSIFLDKLFVKGGFCRRLVKKYVLRKEDVYHSTTLRNLYKKYEKIDVGIGSYGWDSDLFGGPATIGKYVSIGPGVRRFKVNHPIRSISTHPCYFSPEYGWVKNDPRTYTHLSVGNDVWIGADVVITAGCNQIGDGAIVAAGAVVTKDIPPFSIWGGVPARLIGYRFDNNTIQMIENSEWWNLSENILRELIEEANDPVQFTMKVNILKKEGKEG